MASNKHTGYDLHWVEDPSDGLKCLICKLVARDPQQHPGNNKNDCGKIFCLECITEYQKKNTNCPHCQQKLNLFRDARSTKDIKALKVKCKNQGNGCKWKGELESLNTHLESCPFALLPCTYQCTTKDKEITKLLRRNFKQHLNIECTRRPHTCLHCKEEGEYWERTTSHLKTCPKVKVRCPKSQCQERVVRDKLSTHNTICQYEPVSCKYTAVGCEEKPFRKDLKKHEEDDQLHLQMTTRKVLELTEKFAQFEKVKYQLLEFTTLKWRNYQQLKGENAVFYSSPFYTSCSGYKMCLKAYANGTGRYQGTHVSAAACLMKGDHDDTLTWPFTGSVTFELLNQLEDKNHYEKTATFPAHHEASKRVVNGERARIGYGSPQFISHAALDYNASTNTQYLKDDTLVFRVSVKVPNHKPWLDCTI